MDIDKLTVCGKRGRRVGVVVFGAWLAAVAAFSAPIPASGPEPWAPESVERRIEEVRKADVVLVLTQGGRPLAGRGVTVRMARHQFLFGANGFLLDGLSDDRAQEAYRWRFGEIFNAATLPFYWRDYEPSRGEPAESRLDRAVNWCVARGITVKGHTLAWHVLVPAWANLLPVDEAGLALVNRVEREVRAFRGRVDQWDVVNEVMDTRKPGEDNAVRRWCAQLGSTEYSRRLFQAAREADPAAQLLINDYDLSDESAAHTRALLAAGVPIDGIGLQMHMHKGFRPAAEVWSACERFAALGKPLFVSELTILSGALKTDDDWFATRTGWNSTPEGELRQAEEAVATYRLLFSHPAVRGITWWDFSDRQAWQGAPAGLLRANMTPKPAYEALRRLIREEWWTKPVTAISDAEGVVRFRGFLGTYEVEEPGGSPREFLVTTPGEVRVTVTIPPRPTDSL